MNSLQLWMPAHDQASQQPSLGQEGACELSQLAEEIPTVDGFQQRVSQFSLEVWSLEDWPCSGGWSQNNVYKGNTNWIQQII